MRALPIIERVLMVVVVIFIVLVLACLLVWHLRWRAMLADIAAFPPRPGAPPELAAEPGPDLALGLAQWDTQLRSELLRKGISIGDGYSTADLLDGETRRALAGSVPSAALMADLHGLLASGHALHGGPQLAMGQRPPTGHDEVSYLHDTSCSGDPWRLAIEQASSAWVLDVRNNTRPATALADFDVLRSAYRPQTDGEFDTWLTVCAHRDEAYLLADLGRPNPESTARIRCWCAEPCPILDVLIRCLDHERRWGDPAAIAWRFNRNPFSEWWERTQDGQRLMVLSECLANWWNIPVKIEERQTRNADLEDSIIARSNVASVPELWSFPTKTGLAAGQAGWALLAMNRHRLAVLAVNALGVRTAPDRFPGDLSRALNPADLAPGHDSLPLRYHHDRHHLVIDIDDQTPVTGYLHDVIQCWVEEDDHDDPPPLALHPGYVSIDLANRAVLDLQQATDTEPQP